MDRSRECYERCGDEGTIEDVISGFKVDVLDAAVVQPIVDRIVWKIEGFLFTRVFGFNVGKAES